MSTENTENTENAYDRLAPLTVRTVLPETVTEDGATAPTPETRNWIRAVRQGFHEAEPTDAKLVFLAEQLAAKGSRGTVVYDESLGDDPDFGAAFPVATFESFPGELNLSGTPEGMVGCDMITGVTVNPTHRRRGILTTIMTEHLRRAAEKTPVASLTVSEGAIYGRFGFAPTSFWEELEIHTAGAVIRGERSGEIRYVPIERLAELGPGIARGFHERAYGSLFQKEYIVRGLTGEDHEGLRGEMGQRRALIHVAEDGTIDGCATYRHGGWEEVPRPYTLEIFDLIGATPQAEREMWRHFVAMDLVDRIKHSNRSVYTRTFFENPRSVQVRSRTDLVWWRLLDLPSVFARLPFLNDGAARLTVEDPLGLTAGTYDLTVTGGVGALARVEDPAGNTGCTLEVTSLTQILAGRASVRELADVELASGDPEQVAALNALLRFSSTVQSLVNF